jgi:hypothetical protein
MEAVNLSKKNVSEDLRKGDWGQRKRKKFSSPSCCHPPFVHLLASAIIKKQLLYSTVSSSEPSRVRNNNQQRYGSIMAFGLAVEHFQQRQPLLCACWLSRRVKILSLARNKTPDVNLSGRSDMA